MYCRNCGNKVDEKAYICVNCGVILDKESNNANVSVKKNNNTGAGLGVASLVISIIAILLSFFTLFMDISDVGIYTTFAERFGFAIGFNLFQIIFTIVSLCLGIAGRKNSVAKVGIILASISLFFIATEFFIIIVY